MKLPRRYCTKLQILTEVLETFRGCLHDPGATFVPAQFTPVVVPEQNFALIQHLAMVSCKRKMTTGFIVKSVCQWTGTVSACVMPARVFYQHEVYLQITKI